ncbi:hypothetical protein ISS05_01130 [Candidatus Woesearchaeota archaeon]|nr:hypothetical protein [Candidatus Woesearchaeota archaeon]
MKNLWFFVASMFLVFMFTLFISVYSAIHFESIEYMNLMMVFMIIIMVTFFLVSIVYFFSEKLEVTGWIATSFFIGILLIILYAFKAVDTANLTRYSIIYTIIVGAVSCYIVLAKNIRTNLKRQGSNIVSFKEVLQSFTKSQKKPKKSKKTAEKSKKSVKKPKKQKKVDDENPDLKSVLNYLDKNVKK